MSSGFLFKDGRDPDSVFTAYTSGTKPALTKLLHASSGTDLTNLYQPGNSGIVTGILAASGADIGSIFTGSGGAGPIANPTYGNVSSTVGEPSGTWTATANCEINTDGTFLTAVNSNWYAPTTAGIGSSYKVEFVTTTTAHVNGTLTINNPATIPTTISAAMTLGISLQYAIVPHGAAATASGTYTVNIYTLSGTLVSSAGGNWSLTVQYIP